MIFGHIQEKSKVSAVNLDPSGSKSTSKLIQVLIWISWQVAICLGFCLNRWENVLLKSILNVSWAYSLHSAGSQTYYFGIEGTNKILEAQCQHFSTIWLIFWQICFHIKNLFQIWSFLIQLVCMYNILYLGTNKVSGALVSVALEVVLGASWGSKSRIFDFCYWNQDEQYFDLLIFENKHSEADINFKFALFKSKCTISFVFVKCLRYSCP